MKAHEFIPYDKKKWPDTGDYRNYLQCRNCDHIVFKDLATNEYISSTISPYKYLRYNVVIDNCDALIMESVLK